MKEFVCFVVIGVVECVVVDGCVVGEWDVMWGGDVVC